MDTEKYSFLGFVDCYHKLIRDLKRLNFTIFH